jgi:hypothetical protein
VSDDNAGAGKPWWGAPGAVGHTVALNLVVARGPSALVVLSSLVAFSTGFELRVFILRPAPEGPEMADPTWRGSGREPRREVFQLGVELADGRRGTNLDPWPEGDEEPPAPHVRSMIGVTGPPGTFVAGWDLRFWVWPLPPPGPVRVSCRWPVAEVEHAERTLQAERIVEAAKRSLVLG